MDLRVNRAHARLAKTRPTHMADEPISTALRCAGFRYAETAQSDESLTGRGFVYVEPDYRNFPMSKRLEAALGDWMEGKPFKVGTYRIPGLKRPIKKG